MSKEDERSEEELALIRRRLQQAARWSEGGPVPAEPSAPPPENADGAAEAARPRKRGSRKRKAMAADTTVLPAADAEPKGKAGAEPEKTAGTEPGTKAGAEPEKAAGTEPETKAGAEPERAAGTEPGTKAGAEPEKAAGTEPGTKAGAEPEKKAKPARRRRTAKGEKAMEGKPVKTETVTEAVEPAEKSAEPAAETTKPAEPAAPVAAAEKAVELEKAVEPENLEAPEGQSETAETAKKAAEPSEPAEPSETGEPSEKPDTPEEAVAAFAPASEEAFQEILEEERKETERQEEEDRETPRKVHGFLDKLADRKLPRWLAKIVDRLQKMELPEKVNLPKWFGPINKLNLPNQLTLLRIVLIPVMMGLLYWGFPGARYLALLVFIAASITDMLDGRIARKYNLVTDFGKFADPLADKMLVTAAMLWFVAAGHMPAWALLIVVCREFAVSGLRMLASGKGRVIAAGWSGKVKTAATMVCLVLMFFPIPAMLNTICVWVITLTTLYSGVEYFLLNKDVIASI